MEAEKQIMFGQLKLSIIGKLVMSVDKIFTIDVKRAALLEKKILQVLSEFIDEA